MQAMLCEKWGAPRDLRLVQLPEPVAGPDEVLIDVSVCTANFADVLMIAGKYQTRPALPFVPGIEAAGTVSRASPGSAIRVGDRVVAFLWSGGFAQRVTAALADTFVLPRAMPFEVAAALSSAYASAGLALLEVARLQRGEVLMVHGAGGGAGSAAIQIGRAAGARVVALASSAAKLALAGECGAGLALSCDRADWKEEVLRWAGPAGVDVCFDPVGGEIFSPSLSALGWGGRYLAFGFASGTIPEVRLNRLLVKNRALLGFSLRHYRLNQPARLARAMEQLFAWWQSGLLRPRFGGRYPLERAGEALEDLAARRALGKILICMDPQGSSGGPGAAPGWHA